MPAVDAKPGAPAVAQASKWYDSTFLVMILLFVLWPVGVFALIKNRRMGGFGKFVIGGGITGLLFVGTGLSGFAGFWYYKHRTFANLPYVGKYLQSNRVADSSDVPSDKDTPKDSTDADPAKTDLPDLKTPDSIPKPPDTKTADLPSDRPPVPPPTVPDLRPDPAVEAQRLAAERQRETEARQRAQALAEANARREDELKSRALAAAKARLEAAQAEKLRAEREEQEKVARARREQFERERAEAQNNNARALEAQSAEQRDKFLAMHARKVQLAKNFKDALNDYNLAMAIEPHLSNMEVAFKRSLIEKYKSDAIDEEKFYDFFTDDYIRDYNGQLKRQHGTMGQYIKTLRDKDAQLSADEKNLIDEIKAVNAKLTAAGKAPFELPPPRADFEKSLQEIREAAAQLPERVVTMNDLRERFGIKTGRRPPPAVADNRPPPRRDPFDKPPTADIGDTVPLPPAEKPRPPDVVSRPPVRNPPPVRPPDPAAPRPPDAAGRGIAAAELQGDWVRNDGRVTWDFEAAGVMSVRGPRRTQGSWVFDEKTNVLSVTHSGSFLKFTVSRDAEKGSLFMVGGVNANSTMRFNRSVRP